MIEHRRAIWIVAVALGLVIAACGDDAAEDTTTTTTTTPGATTTPVDTTVPGEPTVDLAAVCPSTVVFQLDWEPESEHGTIYRLLGEPYTVDTDTQAVRGPLMASGQATGVDVEIRTGGRAVGFQDAPSLLYQDRDIMFGFGRVGNLMASHTQLPLVGVMATMEKSPFSVYWDPQTYPEAHTIADLKDLGVIIMMGSRDQVLVDFLVAEGIVDAAQADTSSFDKPARFIAAGGTEAEVGFASAEPFLYEFEVAEQWGRPVRVQLFHDVGFPEYFQALVVREDDVTAQADCLAALMPIVQQAGVDYLVDPDPTHRVIVDLVQRYDSGWVYSMDLAEWAHGMMLELGIMANGSDGTFGSFDLGRVDELRSIIGSVTDIDTGAFTADELVTNQFLDPSISLP
jgi:hypothetical protein